MKGPLDNSPFIPSGGGGIDNWPLVQNAGEGNSKNSFVFTVETTGVSETFTLPLEAGGTYNFIIGYGDGEFSLITAFDDAAVTHTYVSAGTYQIVIEGKINGWKFGGVGDCTKMRDIKSWGCLQLGNSNGYFWGCTGLTVSATDVPDLTGMTTLENAFRGCLVLSTVPSMNSWNISAVTTTQRMFQYAYIFNQDLSTLDTSSLECMSRMFFAAYAFDQDIGMWDITSLTNATVMLDGGSLSTANYDALLIGWEAQAYQPNVTIHFGTSKYTAGGAAEAARTALIANGWIITDGGIA